MDAAEGTGVRRYVMVSWTGSRADHGVDQTPDLELLVEFRPPGDGNGFVGAIRMPRGRRAATRRDIRQPNVGG